VRRVVEAGHLILSECIAAGGALTGEHGVGLEKLPEMELYFGKDDLAAACRMREAWDPQRRLNPGKLIPTHACLEVRAAGRRAAPGGGSA
jgi:glycolate oxidase